MQVSGDRTFEYDLPAKDGLDVDMMAEDGSYVSIEVYETAR